MESVWTLIRRALGCASHGRVDAPVSGGSGDRGGLGAALPSAQRWSIDAMTLGEIFRSHRSDACRAGPSHRACLYADPKDAVGVLEFGVEVTMPGPCTGVIPARMPSRDIGEVGVSGARNPERRHPERPDLSQQRLERPRVGLWMEQ